MQFIYIYIVSGSQILEKKWEYNEAVHQLFIDFKKAHDSVRREVLYRVSQEERAKLRESVPYVELYRYNPKHLYPKLNGYGVNGNRSLKL